MGIGENVGENVGENTGQSGQANTGVGLVWFDDFEDGTTDKWTDTGAEIRTTAHDGGSPLSGTYMASVNWNAGGTPVIEGLELPSGEFTYNKEFFVRMYLRFDDDVDEDRGAKLYRMGWNAGDTAPQDSSIYSAIWDSITGLLFATTINESAAKSLTITNPFFDNEWHKIEMYMCNDSSGILDIWLDDTKVNDPDIYYEGNTVGSPNNDWTTIYLPSNWSNPLVGFDNNNHMYVDEVQIFSDTGNGASGSMSDATVQA